MNRFARLSAFNNLVKKPLTSGAFSSTHRTWAPAMVKINSVRLYSGAPPPLEMSQIEERVLQLLRDFDKVSASKLTPDAHFVNDLGLDSLDQVEITMALEEDFNIEIPDKDAEQIFTVRQAVEKVRHFNIELTWKIFANRNAV